MNRRLAIALTAGIGSFVLAILGVILISSPRSNHGSEGEAPASLGSPVDAGLAPFVTTSDASADVSAEASADASADAGDADAALDPDAGQRLVNDPRCRQLSAEIARMAARIAAADPSCKVTASEIIEQLDHCAATAAGAWSLVPRRFSVQRDSPTAHLSAEVDVEVALVHLGAPGSTGDAARSETVPFDQRLHGGLATNWSRVCATRYGSLSLSLVEPGFVDFDGDGDLEVLLSRDEVEEGYDPSEHAIYTFARSSDASGGRVELYPPARGIDFEDVSDVDGDGRPDLLTRGPYGSIQVVSGGLGDEMPLVPAMFLQHALPDGTFSPRDEVALQALRKICPTAPSLRGASLPVEDVARDMICARLHGVRAATIRAQLLPTCSTLGNSLLPDPDDPPDAADAGPVCPGWVDQVLTVPPFLHLP